MKKKSNFSASQQKNVDYRLNRIKEVVEPKMRAICENSYFKNVTSFRKVCADIFNESLPVGDKKITYRTIGTAPYWDALGAVYYSYFSKDNNEKKYMVASLTNDIANWDKFDAMEQERKKLLLQLEEKSNEISLLENTLLNSNINPLSVNTPKGDGKHQEVIANLMATINWLLERTEDMIIIDKEKSQIIDLSVDQNGTLNPSISNTYFQLSSGEVIE